MSTHGHDPLDDATIVSARLGGTEAVPVPPPATGYPLAPAAAEEISGFLGRGLNPLVQAASPLLLAVQLRHSTAAGDAEALRAQVQVQVRRFDARLADMGVPAQAATAARYVLCAMVDEAV